MTDPRFENTSASISLLNHHHLEMSAEAIDGDVVMEEPPAEEVRSRYSAQSHTTATPSTSQNGKIANLHTSWEEMDSSQIHES